MLLDGELTEPDPDQIARWTPRPLHVLGTDGFGRSDTREALRRLHKIDAECIVVTVLAELAGLGKVDRDVVAKAIDQYGIDTDRWPYIGYRHNNDVTS